MKYWKSVACAMLLALSCNASASKEALQLNEDQIYVVNRAYELGQDMDFGLTFAAIALKESSAGEHRINNKSKDYGVFHNNLKYAVKSIEQIQGRKMTYKEIRGLRQQLIRDMEFSASLARINLEFWQGVHGKNNWSKVVASYNAGYNYKGSNGQSYMKDVRNKMKQLRESGYIEALK